MSQFSTMTTKEKKMQAAAICREVYGSEDVEMDLGKKVSIPKDIMLEELSFASNRGSRLFKMRQRRSEKYTFESIQNEANSQINYGIVAENGLNTDCQCGENSLGMDQSPKTPPNTPDTRAMPNPDSIAPGYGGPLKDIPPERFNSTAVPKSYHSPWDQAIFSDPDLKETFLVGMPKPEPQTTLPQYKSFNKVATPFGGFAGSPRPVPIKAPELDPLPDYPELQGDTSARRTTFNRTALGWVSTGAPIIPTISLEPVAIPESDDL